MPSIGDNAFAADQHGSHRRAPDDENPGIEPVIACAGGNIGMRSIEQHNIGASANLNCPDPPRAGLGSTRQCCLEQMAANSLAFAHGEHVARTQAQALTIFELTQFSGGINLNIGIGADAETPAGGEIASAVEHAIA